MADNWVPIPDDEARSVIGEGLHTGLRKGTDAPESVALWDAIRKSDRAWTEALGFMIWGLDYMGLKVCKKTEVPE